MPDKPFVSKPNFKSEDFVSAYANNVGFDLTGWDIALLFGNLVKTETETETEVRVEQHTEMRLSWPQAKVAALLFAVNVAAQEESGGPIKIPPGVIPHIVSDKEVAMPLVDIVRRMLSEEDAVKASAKEKPTVQG
jgi:hypothetical protein